MIRKVKSIPLGWNQSHRDSRPSMTACLGCWAMGTDKVKMCTVRKIIFCIGPTRAAKAEQKSIILKRRAQRTDQGRIPSICTLRVPMCLSFNSQQRGGDTPFWSHWMAR